MYVYACIYPSSHQVVRTEGYLNNPPTCAANIVTLQEFVHGLILQLYRSSLDKVQFYKPHLVKYFKCC